MRIVRIALVVAAGAVVVLALGGSSLATGTLIRTTPADSSASSGVSARDLSWLVTATGTGERLRGVSAVSRSVAWVSGTAGTVLRTTDGGASWASVGPAETSTLQFRDIEATSAQHAVILSSGSATESRIYITDDGGASWTESFRNQDERAFYDCITFTSPQRGLALSDAVDGAFRLLETDDGGRSWALVNPDGMPAALPNEFAFAASGQCLTSDVDQSTYLGSGGQSPARVFSSSNGGHTWSVTEVPVVGAPSAGVFSVRFRDRLTGVAVGGDYANPTAAIGTAAWTADGQTWQPASPTPSGYRSGSAWLPNAHDVAIAVGPSGSDVSVDEGRRWTSFDAGSFDSVACAPDGGCWASGEQGRVAHLVVTGK
jgi:photosystem II stability/assembly factor-like uncharacterized protein